MSSANYKFSKHTEQILNIELRPPSKNGAIPVQLFRPISGLISEPMSHLPTSMQLTVQDSCNSARLLNEEIICIIIIALTTYSSSAL